MSNNKIKIVYMGTPNFAADVLQKIYRNSNFEIVSVYTQADAVRGRGNKLVCSPVKSAAQDFGLTVETPLNFKEEADILKLKSYAPDFIVVAAYGIILPQAVLDIPKFACLNIHGSLLPKWRGAAPVQRAILNGDKQTGVTIMKMDAGMDTGDYCCQASFSLHNMYCNEVFNKMVDLGSEKLFECICNIKNGTVNWKSQDETGACIANKLEKKELWLDNADSCDMAYKKILASNNQHVCKCKIMDRSVRLIKACKSAPKDDDCIYLKFKDEFLAVEELKPDGKNIMSSKAFLSGIQNCKSNILTWGSIL